MSYIKKNIVIESMYDTYIRITSSDSTLTNTNIDRPSNFDEYFEIGDLRGIKKCIRERLSGFTIHSIFTRETPSCYPIDMKARKTVTATIEYIYKYCNMRELRHKNKTLDYINLEGKTKEYVETVMLDSLTDKFNSKKEIKISRDMTVITSTRYQLCIGGGKLLFSLKIHSLDHGEILLMDFAEFGNKLLLVLKEDDNSCGLTAAFPISYKKNYDFIYNYLMDLTDYIKKEEKKYMLISAKTTTNKDEEYTKYIQNHVAKVTEAFNKYGKELCRAIEVDYYKVSKNIYKHDQSKYSAEEFEAYRNKFYPDDTKTYDKDGVEYEFKLAWSHHIHNNPHHPEHWVHYDEKGNKTIFNMPKEYIVEMICDWESFRKEDGTGGAYDFYYHKDHKEGLLTERTRFLVERCLEVVK